jgi:hypothetical protein
VNVRRLGDVSRRPFVDVQALDSMRFSPQKLRSAQVNIPLADPADRFPAATASVDEPTPVTADE